MYGKTSDKELYGVSLPPSMIYNAPTTKKNDIVLEHTGNYEASGFDQSGSTYPYNKYKKHINYKQSLKPEQSMNYFSYSENDGNKKPEEINTLNKTPQRGNQNIDLSSKINLQGFKPFIGNGENEHTSIRSILSTERNEIGAGEVLSEDNRIYRNKPRNKVRQYKGKTFNFRTKCPSRNCRKKSNTSKRFFSRPVKRVKKRIIVY